MVAWISGPGRIVVARFGALIAAAGLLLALAGPRVWRVLFWPGAVVALLGIAIVFWAFFHKTISGYPVPRQPMILDSEPAWSWTRVGDETRGPIILITFGGFYPPGSAGNELAARMIEFAREAMNESRAKAVIFDLFDLQYTWGDAICGLATVLLDEKQRFRPAAIIAGGRTASALEPLLAPNMFLGLAGIKLAKSGDEALLHVQQALASAAEP